MMVTFEKKCNALQQTCFILCTLPETNIEFTPEKGWLEYDPASFWGVKAYFQG